MKQWLGHGSAQMREWGIVFISVWKDRHLSYAICEETWKGRFNVCSVLLILLRNTIFHFYLRWAQPNPGDPHQSFLHYFVLPSWFLFFIAHPFWLVWYHGMSLLRNVVVSYCHYMNSRLLHIILVFSENLIYLIILSVTLTPREQISWFCLE